VHTIEYPLILSLDIGTSSARALLFDAQGRALLGLEARRAYEIPVRADGAVETDADELLGHVWACIDEVMTQARHLTDQIAGVAVCTFVGNVLGLDAFGHPATPLITYADTRAAHEAAELRRRLDEEIFHQRTGCHFHSSYLPARFLWLQKAQPALLNDAKRWITLGEYLALQLFGETAVSYSVASWSGLLNQQLDWDTELLEVLPLSREQLSPLVDVDQPWRGLRSEFAARWPALRAVPWFPAIGDGAAANVGSGCTGPSRVAISVGTTSAVRVVMTDPVPSVPPGLWRYRVDRKRSLLGGALSEGGSVVAWLKRLLNFENLADVESVLSAAPADGHRLTFLPLITGERSPGWAAEARGVIAGLSSATTPLDILQAGIEGVNYRLALVFDLLAPSLPAAVEVVGSGGALQSSGVWPAILSHVLGRPVRVTAVDQPSARGAALLALEALDILDDPGQLPAELGPLYFPDPEKHAIYREAIERQRALYEDGRRRTDEGRRTKDERRRTNSE
jgi:gluconokinase